MTYPDEVLVGSTIQPAHIHETRFSMSYTAWSLRHSRTVATGYGQVGPNVRAHHEPSHSVRMCAQHEPFHSVVVSCQPAGGGYRSDVDDALKHKRRINLSVQACLPFPFPFPSLPFPSPFPFPLPLPLPFANDWPSSSYGANNSRSPPSITLPRKSSPTPRYCSKRYGISRQEIHCIYYQPSRTKGTVRSEYSTPQVTIISRLELMLYIQYKVQYSNTYKWDVRVPCRDSPRISAGSCCVPIINTLLGCI